MRQTLCAMMNDSTTLEDSQNDIFCIHVCLILRLSLWFFFQKQGAVFREVHQNKKKFTVSSNTDKTRRDQHMSEGACIMARKSALTECYNVFIKLIGAEKQYTAGPSDHILFSVCRCIQTHNREKNVFKQRTKTQNMA